MKKLSAILIVIALYLPAMAQSVVNRQVLALTGAKIYPSPGAKPITAGVVLVQDGKITAVGSAKTVKIPTDAYVIDGKGKVLTAGFWNCHVHFIEPKWLHADSLPAAQLSKQLSDMFGRYGFTHVFDLAVFDFSNLLALRKRITAGEVSGPAIMSVGVPFTPPNGSPVYIRPLKLPEIGTPAEATAYVQKQIQAGADGIKIWAASPNGREVVPMPLDVARAAVSAAHALGKPVFAHPTSDAGVEIAIESGVDILAHVAPDDHRPWDTATIHNLLRHKTALIPSLKLFKWELLRIGLPLDNGNLIATALQQAGSYVKAGGEILFGTDVGYVTDYSTTDEFDFLAQAGFSFDQILTALTTAPAKKFGLGAQTGRVAVGMDADLVLLEADPATDSKRFADVACTIAKGKIIYQAGK